MSLISRFTEFMDENSINATQLAEKIGVQKSSISHILSGRNKPSLDFVVKLLKAYPSLDIYWLLNGQSKSKNISSDNTGQKPLIDLFSEPNNKNSDLREEKVVSNIRSENGKTITKIVIFYDDFSFDEYKPRS